ncbi:MAG: NAD(P)-dependent oxidoreductase [bacterium]|nr:NAD(P)-dependent oxidoreductase [bacterium]
MNPAKKLIMVTGASGLIGSAVVQRLARDKRFKVLGIHYRGKPLWKDQRVTLLKKDLSLKESWEDLLNLPVAAVIHCAALIPPAFTGLEARHAGMVNLRMDRLAVWYARKKSARIIYISSSSIYGTSGKKMKSEITRLKPYGDYAAGKAAAEKMIQHYPDHYIFRISAPYGPYQHMNTVLRIFIQQALAGKPLLYYGTGSRTQDFTYTADIAAACVKAIYADYPGIYNIAAGRPISMRKLAHLVKKLTRSKSEIKAAGLIDPQENYQANFNTSKARSWLRWSPAYTLSKGIKEFIKYLKSSGS